MKYEQPDLTAHALFRKLLKKADFGRTPGNLKQLAQNINEMKARHEERRMSETVPQPQVEGLIRRNPRKVEMVLSGIAATIGLGAMSNRYPMSRQSEKVETEREEETAQGKKKESRFGFAQVQGVALLLVAVALGYSAYKGGVITNWALGKMGSERKI